jgi:hypothetical protein
MHHYRVHEQKIRSDQIITTAIIKHEASQIYLELSVGACFVTSVVYITLNTKALSGEG